MFPFLHIRRIIGEYYARFQELSSNIGVFSFTGILYRHLPGVARYLNMFSITV